MEEEYSVTEKGIQFVLESQEAAGICMEPAAMRRMLLSLHAVHNGVFAMSQDMEGLVETSSNLASIHLEGDRFTELKRNGRPEMWIMSKGLKYTTYKFMYTFAIWLYSMLSHFGFF